MRLAGAVTNFISITPSDVTPRPNLLGVGRLNVEAVGGRIRCDHAADSLLQFGAQLHAHGLRATVSTAAGLLQAR